MLTYTSGDQEVTAIHPCSLQIPEGSITVIYGSSGSGKSSLLNILSGLQKPTKGTLNFYGEDVYRQSHNELAYFRAHELGIVYQTNYWVKSLSVIDNISLPLFFQGESKESAHQKTLDALRRVDMEKYAHKYPVLLSGGEQQRVAMARAIVSDPPVIIADEPTGSLDTENGNMIIKLLQKLQKEGNKTIIMVTHNLEYLYIADHLLEIQDGKIEQIEQDKIASTVRSMLSDTRKRITGLMEDGK